MDKINFSKRLRNKTFLVALFAFISMVLKDLGVDFPLENYVDPLLYLLILGGIVVDPTTPGVTDGEEK